MKQRVLYLDMIRIFACIMIIAMHSPIPNTGLDSYLLSADSFFSAPGIGLFVMVSGALLLPIKTSTQQFLKKRFCKIVGPTLFWTLFYFFVAPYTDTVDQGNGIMSFISIPFTPQFNSVLWFMYMLAGLYLLAPILSVWLKQASKREIEFYLCLWGLTMCYPLIRNYITLNEGHSGILYYFGGYAGYFMLGYYLKKYTSFPLWKSLLLLIVPLVVATTIKLLGVLVDFYDLFWYLSIFVAMMSSAWFTLFKKLSTTFNPASKLHRFIVMTSNCCFGIYLIHIFIMRSFLWRISFFQNEATVIQIVMITILTFVSSFIIIWLISYLPFAEYIIGFRNRKYCK